MLKEAAPVLYGDNHFQLDDFADMKIFLEVIGSMRPYLHHIHVDSNGYWYFKARSTLNLLRDVKDLRTLTFDHADICESLRSVWSSRYFTTPTRLAGLLFPAFRAINKAQHESGSSINVLDIVKIKWFRCTKCYDLDPAFANDDDCVAPQFTLSSGRSDCKIKCKDLAAHSAGVEAKVRKELARYLDIKE
jgi:hypothetical protein